MVRFAAAIDTDYRRRTRSVCFVELAVDGSVPDILRRALSVDRWMVPGHQGNIWQRQPSATEI